MNKCERYHYDQKLRCAFVLPVFITAQAHHLPCVKLKGA
jgi:hypothetical protein